VQCLLLKVSSAQLLMTTTIPGTAEGETSRSIPTFHCDWAETSDLCRDRAECMPHYPNITRGFGRGFVVHHHGALRK
jgi:hypothetical protein